MNDFLSTWLPAFLTGALLGGFAVRVWCWLRPRPERARIERPFQAVDVALLGRLWRGIVVQVQYDGEHDTAVVELVAPAEFMRRYGTREGR